MFSTLLCNPHWEKPHAIRESMIDYSKIVQTSKQISTCLVLGRRKWADGIEEKTFQTTKEDVFAGHWRSTYAKTSCKK